MKAHQPKTSTGEAMKLYRWFGFYQIKNPKSVRVRIMPYTMKPQIRRFR